MAPPFSIIDNSTAPKQWFDMMSSLMRARGVDDADVARAYHGFLLGSKELSAVNVKSLQVPIARECDGTRSTLYLCPRRLPNAMCIVQMIS